MTKYLIIGGIIAAVWLIAFCCKGFLLSSPKKWIHAIGGSIKFKLLVAMELIVAWFAAIAPRNSTELMQFSILAVCVGLTIWISLIVKGVLMKDVRAKNDSYNFVIQSIILLAIGALICGAVLIFNLNNDEFLLFGILSVILGWIFQDIIKGVMAFYHMYWNGLIHLGDWIVVPSKGVDGIVKDISLIHVTIQNWDDTIASVPMAALQTEHLTNRQNMLDGKTYGRKMTRDFIIDSSSIREMTEDEVAALFRDNEALRKDNVWMSSIKSYPVLNVTLFRLYLLHWMMNHEKVSRRPRLMVMLMDPTAEGIPLQIYAFLTEYSRPPFELVQSQIMEHAVMSMRWFGLKLYQRPAGYDLTKAVAKGGEK